MITRLFREQGNFPEIRQIRKETFLMNSVQNGKRQ